MRNEEDEGRSGAQRRGPGVEAGVDGGRERCRIEKKKRRKGRGNLKGREGVGLMAWTKWENQLGERGVKGGRRAALFHQPF